MKQKTGILLSLAFVLALLVPAATAQASTRTVVVPSLALSAADLAADTVQPMHTKATCDYEYHVLGNRCRRMRGARARAICWAAAASAYAICLASADPGGGGSGGGGGGGSIGDW